MSLVIKKSSITEIDDYLTLLNNYYSQYAEFLSFDSSREKKKRILLQIFGLFSKKYKNQNQLYVIYDGSDKIGFNEYTNHKVGLLSGYLKVPNIHMDQTHLFEQFYGKGYARRIWAEIHSQFPQQTVISTTIEVNNIPSIKAALKFGFHEYKTLHYFELGRNDYSSFELKRPASTRLEKYKSSDSGELFNFYKVCTPANVFEAEALSKSTFDESFTDRILDNVVKVLSGVSENAYFIMEEDNIAGFLVYKKRNGSGEFKILAKPGHSSTLQYHFNTFLRHEIEQGLEKFSIYINDYQHDEIRLLEETGFKKMRSLNEYIKVV